MQSQGGIPSLYSPCFPLCKKAPPRNAQRARSQPLSTVNMTITLANIRPDDVRSALLIPCNKDSTNDALTVQVFTKTGQHITLAGEEAADFWKAWKG